MKLTFLGATHEVTGSCFLLTACGKHVLIDCGMEQGPNLYTNQEIPVSAHEIDFALLTHAHIDHSGMLPLLYKNGFHGQIHATDATADLCDIMLRDSAHIQEFEAEWRNRKGKRSGAAEYVPIYTMDDAVGAIGCFVPHPYNVRFQLCEGIELRMIDVGHLLGSASIEIWVTEDGVTKKLVFSGDIGNFDQPLLRNPQYIPEADVVIMEST
ncbi:MAG: MBL fold metallo-hydrolase, partial [Oscillospiraceae bacterium]